MHQTMREVLRVIASLAGVELPGLPPGLQDDEAPPPRLEIKTLKDRFRNELEGFSIKTTEELAKRAKEQTQAALDAVQNEVVGARVDQAAAELREKLKSPAQIEKFVEPAVKEAAAGLEKAFSEKVEQLFAQQQQLVQDKLQGALSSVQAQVSTQVDAEFREILQLPAHIEKLVEPCVGEAAAKLERSLTEKVERLFAEQQQLVQDRVQGALNSSQAQVSTLEQTVQQLREQKAASVGQLSTEQSTAKLEASLSQKVERLFTEQQQVVQDRLQGALNSFQAQIKGLEQTVRQVRDHEATSAAQLSTEQSTAKLEASLSQKVERLFTEQQQVVQDRVQGALNSVQAQIKKLEQTVQQVREQKSASLSAEQSNTALEKSLSQKVEGLGAHQQLVQDRLQGALNSVQTQIGTLEQTVQQIREQKAASVAQVSAEDSNASLEKSLSEKLEHLFAEHHQLVQDRLQGTLSSVQAQISTLEQTMQQIRDQKATTVAPVSAAQPNAAADNAAKKDESRLNHEANRGLDQAFSRVESSFNKLMESFKKQPAQTGVSGVEVQRKKLRFNDAEIDSRVEQALDYLDRLGTKSPQPVS